jgi:hypothetical protein
MLRNHEPRATSKGVFCSPYSNSRYVFVNDRVCVQQKADRLPTNHVRSSELTENKVAERVGFSIAVFEKQLKHGFLSLFPPVRPIPV